MGPNANKVEMKDFSGVFYSRNIGIDVGISFGGGISWSSPIDGAYIIGVSTTFGVGVSPTIISAGAYGGYMKFYSKNKN